MASSSQIKPGEKGTIVVTLDADSYKGQVVKEIWVYSNDPKKPMATLVLKAEVVRE
jgi:hypothetical protein